MARRRNRRPVIPEAGRSLDAFKVKVMKNEGYNVGGLEPNQVKYEVAKTLGIPLQKGYNGNMRTEDAGKIGGQIGGAMVREMIRIAQESLAKEKQR